jgi:hypothetical protein
MQTVFNLLVVAEGVERQPSREQCRALYSQTWTNVNEEFRENESGARKAPPQGETNE